MDGLRINGYPTAAALNLAIAPFTQFAMIPTNFALIETNERKSGARSEKSFEEASHRSGERSAEDFVNSKGVTNEFKDLSGPQSQTSESTTMEEDEKTRELLGRFGRLNLVRAALTGVGGIVGLVAALS